MRRSGRSCRHRSRGGVDHPRRFWARTTATGLPRGAAQLWLVEPSSRPAKPPRPRDPTTVSAAPADSATRTAAGRPWHDFWRTGTSGYLSRYPARASANSRASYSRGSSVRSRAAAGRWARRTRATGRRAARRRPGRAAPRGRRRSRRRGRTGPSRPRRPRPDRPAGPRVRRRVAVADDDDRAGGVGGGLDADGPDEQSGEPAKAAVTDHHQGRVVGGVDQRRGGRAHRQVGADLQGGCGSAGTVGGGGQDVLRRRSAARRRADRRRAVQRYVEQRPPERVHDPQRALPARAASRAAQSRACRLCGEPSTPTTIGAGLVVMVSLLLLAACASRYACLVHPRRAAHKGCGG